MTDAAVPTFSPAERDRRWDLAREFMRAEGLDAMLVFGEHEDAGPAPFVYDTWFTNDRAGTTVVIPRDGDPICHFPMEMFARGHLESTRRGERPWIPPENTRARRDSRALAATLHELGLATATIGVIGLEPAAPWHPEGIMPYRLWSGILEAFPGAQFRPVTMDFSRIIMALGPEQIAAVRHSAGIGDAMAQAMVDSAAAGVAESDVYAAGMAAGYAAGTTPSAMHLWSGPSPLARGLPPWSYRPHGPRTLRDGDVVSAEVFCQFGGHHTQHQVTIAVGDPSADLVRAAGVARAVYDAGLDALRPGRTFGEAVAAMRTPLRAADGWEFGPPVHALNPFIAAGGFSAPAPGQNPGAEAYQAEGDHSTIGADLELRPGMTFALEPNYVIGGHLAYLGGTVIVGEDETIELNPYTAQILRAGRATVTAG